MRNRRLVRKFKRSNNLRHSSICDKDDHTHDKNVTGHEEFLDSFYDSPSNVGGPTKIQHRFDSYESQKGSPKR